MNVRIANVRSLSKRIIVIGSGFQNDPLKNSSGFSWEDLMFDGVVVAELISGDIVNAALRVNPGIVANLFGHLMNFACFMSSSDPARRMYRVITLREICLLYTSPSPRDGLLSRMPSSA